jgi:carbon storage regulator
MIVIHRVKDEGIIINDEIILTVIEVREDEVRLRIEYPEGVAVHRQEVYEAIQPQARILSEARPRG